MSKRDIVLAWVWLGLGALGGLAGTYGAWWFTSVGAGNSSDVSSVLATLFGCALGVGALLLWTLPLVLAGVAMLRGKPSGRRLLLVHSMLGAVGWSLGTYKVLPGAVGAHGLPGSGAVVRVGFVCVALLAALSWYTAITLWRDNSA